MTYHCDFNSTNDIWTDLGTFNTSYEEKAMAPHSGTLAWKIP